jgi:hypothetical protein
MRRLALILLFCTVAAFAKRPKPCITADEAVRLVNKDVGIEAGCC